MKCCNTRDIDQGEIEFRRRSQKRSQNEKALNERLHYHAAPSRISPFSPAPQKKEAVSIFP